MSLGILDLWRQALELLVWTGGPFLAVALAVGLAASVFQAATQLQENLIAFAPKLAAIGAVLVFGGSWLLSQLVTYLQAIGEAVERVGRYGY
jgi:flagellar biosynthetic protein FliQ